MKGIRGKRVGFSSPINELGDEHGVHGVSV